MGEGARARAIDSCIERTRASSAAFEGAVTALGVEGLERATPSGWTGKEMLAHVAFWDEAVYGAVQGMFRSLPLEGWSFGSGYTPAADGEWPEADVHNAREAAWARERTGAEVVERWRAAQAQLFAVLDTVTDDEVAEHAEYFATLGRHHDEHRQELEST
jgi:hypothetical protein